MLAVNYVLVTSLKLIKSEWIQKNEKHNGETTKRRNLQNGEYTKQLKKIKNAV